MENKSMSYKLYIFIIRIILCCGASNVAAYICTEFGFDYIVEFLITLVIGIYGMICFDKVLFFLNMNKDEELS